MMPVIIHRGCDLPLHYEAVEYYDGLGLTWVCPLHGAVPTFQAAIQGEDTEPIVPIPLPRLCPDDQEEKNYARGGNQADL